MKEAPNIELKWREVGFSFQVQFIKSNFTLIVNEGVNEGVNLKGEEQLY